MRPSAELPVTVMYEEQSMAVASGGVILTVSYCNKNNF
jgi:hypothetical protein